MSQLAAHNSVASRPPALVAQLLPSARWHESVRVGRCRCGLTGFDMSGALAPIFGRFLSKSGGRTRGLLWARAARHGI